MLFLTCPFSQWCWRLLHIRCNIGLEITERVIRARRDFNSCFFREIMLVASWEIWRHRNEVVFDGVPPSPRRWKKIFRD
ncbi:hypothetical protein HU200_010079 [Digitaria exilis]|uniref:Uncharacterized protein n=1 Tax=Digitaria exilis TaxID=1010633 RepID=A0A835FJM9_9POAL|nr:hypothetical protein HU200_010079 [Digitaria exilis]